MSTSINKGYLIDEHCDNKGGELISVGDIVYSCTLNQTEIDANKNKFYIMQIIKDGSSYIHFIRYGRIGEPGKASHKSYQSQSAAISAFEKQFKTKTGNSWGAKQFNRIEGKYFLSKISYEDELKDVVIKPINIPDSKLDPSVQNLLRMLSDINMMKNILIQLDLDTKKMPLGKLKSEQIDAAADILNKISLLIDNGGDDKQISSLSSEYYTYIPNACGRRKPPAINNKEIIGKYKDILDDLLNIVVTKKIIDNSEQSGDINPIDSLYMDLGTNISPLDKDQRIYSELDKYIANTHGSTHGCKLQLLEAFNIEQKGKGDVYNEYSKDIDNKMLLFHGTPQSCVLSIFKKDFYLDPSKLGVQIAGKMFGYGVYFADIATKSFNYTRANATGDIGCLIMCEIAVGKPYKRYDADCGLNKDKIVSKGYDSTLAMGRWQPDGSTTLDNMIIPNGQIKDTGINTSLRYNEYIVYDIRQINIKYLLIVKNNGNYSGY